jgi:Protein of unknown function (DUF3019)
MLRLRLPAWFSGFASRARRAGWLAASALACVLAHDFAFAADGITLELSPRVCTLSAGDENCDTVVTAQWRASRDESLCLLIVDHPDIRRCWENHAEGVYSVRLVFNTDLHVELRDPQLQEVLASEAIAVIKEALRLRRKRRQPWDILP